MATDKVVSLEHLHAERIANVCDLAAALDGYVTPITVQSAVDGEGGFQSTECLPKLALTPELCGGLLQLDGRIGSPILVAQPRCRTTAAARGRTRSRCSLSAARPRSRPVSAGCQQLTHAPELAMKLRKTYCSRRFWIQHAEALVDLVGQRGRMHAGSRKRSTKKRVRNLSFAAKACTRHANDREDEETVDPYSTHCVRMDANGSGAVHTGASDPVDEPRRFSA